MPNIEVIPLGTVAPYPKGNKNCPGFLIKYNNYNIMLDCGNGCLSMLNLPNDLNNLKIFISHLHPDHFGDLVSLLQAIYVYKKYGMVDNNIELYIPNGDMETETYSEKGSDGWYGDKKYTVHSLEYRYIEKYAKEANITIKGYNNLELNENGIKIKTLKVLHPISTYAFRIDTIDGSITYSADTGVYDCFAKFANKSNLLICESTFLKGQYRSSNTHLYAHEAARIAKDANVEKLLLTHFWPEIDKEKYVEEAKEIFNNTEAAIEGKKLILRR